MRTPPRGPILASMERRLQMIQAYDTDDKRWAAGRARDRRADGHFYTAVRTTGVYCLPSCAGRPMRENVEYHLTAEAARAAGFRPCKRCRPDDLEQLRWGSAPTALGRVAAAVSAKGLRAVVFADSPSEALADLERRFPRARFSEDSAGLAAVLADIAGLVVRPSTSIQLKLDAHGTELQEKVWAALRDIPPGETASYADVARAIGRPEAVRAVAQACGANPLAVVTPCHRVVRSDGSLSGYRWGQDRKRALLAREAAA
jgi:AraC family transcriptional regulator of adaptative response/methylated-DNA-[protein]-cysteine methyltransferase